MKKIVISEKVGGLKSPDSFLLIVDERGKPFYEKKKTQGQKIIYINLPKGVYYTDNNFILCEKRKYKHRGLYKPERNIELPENFSFVVAENPNKCSIFLNRGVIVFDKSFKDSLSKPELVFILFHEIGHYFYSTEKKCDVFAAYYMLKRGYNPYQIAKAQQNTLSNKAHCINRKIDLLNKFK